MSRLSKRAYVLQNLESLIAWHTAQLITANKQFDEAQQFYIFTASKTGKGSSTAFFKLKMMDNKARQVQQLMFWRQIWSWSGLPKTARLEKRPLKRSLKLWIWAPASTELLSCPSPKHPHLSRFEWVRCITCAITQIYSNALKVPLLYSQHVTKHMCNSSNIHHSTCLAQSQLVSTKKCVLGDLFASGYTKCAKCPCWLQQFEASADISSNTDLGSCKTSFLQQTWHWLQNNGIRIHLHHITLMVRLQVICSVLNGTGISANRNIILWSQSLVLCSFLLFKLFKHIWDWLNQILLQQCIWSGTHELQEENLNSHDLMTERHQNLCFPPHLICWV